MDATEIYNKPPVITGNLPDSPDTKEATDTSIIELFPNYAEHDGIVEQTKKRITSIFSSIRDRGDMEDIWKKNDEMYRVKPDPDKDEKHRANEATGVFHISVNQLVAMSFKTFTDNPDNYKYGFRAVLNDEVGNIYRSKNAEIMTLLLQKSLSQSHFKSNLRKSLYDVYKNGNCLIGIPWEKQIVDLQYRDKVTGNRKSKEFTQCNLPKFENIPLDKVWLDENIESIDGQPGTFIRSPISWTKLLSDSKKNNVKLFKPDGDESLRNKFEKYKETTNSTEFNNALADRHDNADRTLQDRTTELYRHWVVWVNLPIDKETSKWGEDVPEIRCRVRLLGDPESCEIIEIRENIFPGGVPVISAHQTEDDVGMYHISLGEKIASYYDQICVAIDQLIDNRSKNVRRPLFYDPLRVEIDKYDFGHSNAIPTPGVDPRTVIYEAQIADMTATIMTTIQYCEQKVKEIMNTTDAVTGQAMGGRTSASEYMGAKVAATTPIFSDMACIEDALIGEYMRRFAQYIHVFMTHDDIVQQIGPIGAEFQFDLSDIYTIELRGVSEAMDKATKVQNLLQLFNLTQDANARPRILLRLAEAMGVENPNEFVTIPAKDQAIKAALWENNEMLVHGQWDEPETGEMHDIHLPIHKQALWQAQREPEKNLNIPLMQEHISFTEQLKKQAEAGAGGSFPGGYGQPVQTNRTPLPGDLSGQAISASLGNINAGSPIPQSEPSMPVGQ